MGETRTIEEIRENLTALGLAVEDGPEPSILAFPAAAPSGSWTTFVWLREPQDQVVVHSVVPFAVPVERREAVALYLTRANYGLILGNFEMDLDDGEVRFKTSIDFGAPGLDLEMLRRHVGTSLRAVDRYLPGLLEVIGGGDPAAAALQADLPRPADDAQR